jgi:hypothetical protein
MPVLRAHKPMSEPPGKSRSAKACARLAAWPCAYRALQMCSQRVRHNIHIYMLPTGATLTLLTQRTVVAQS